LTQAEQIIALLASIDQKLSRLVEEPKFIGERPPLPKGMEGMKPGELTYVDNSAFKRWFGG
jgi:hypothetical protein